MIFVQILDIISIIVGLLFAVLYCYQIVYILVSLFSHDTPHKESKPHRYAILIAARNEEAVLPHLLDSIAGQDYPADLITTFVIADNCTDATAQVARAHGAKVYERQNKNLIGKGYALDYLISNISADYGTDSFDAYFVFDADNLLESDYITEMNKTYSDGYEVITSYRNSKNYGDSWISSGNALWFLHEAVHLNKPRMRLGTSCAVSGTGFLFSSKILQEAGGWKFYLLTEDVQFSAWNILCGRRIAYCPSARFYDEQPTSFRQSWKQRLRWSKGCMQVFVRYIVRLIAGMFRGPLRFSCYDIAMVTIPSMGLGIVGVVWVAFRMIVDLVFGGTVLAALISLITILAQGYLSMFLLALLIIVTEWKHICAPLSRKIISLFTFPIYMATYIPIGICAVFRHVKWEPIVHTKAVTISNMQMQ